ncbi:MAG: DUF1028 domain-containing protein [Thermoplasmata archaeon]
MKREASKTRPSTFSIVALDQTTGDLGVATQSKFIAVGAVVPWAEAKVGAVATQAAANVSYGSRGLEMLKSGRHPQEVVKRMTEADEEADIRQVGIVDSKGRAEAFTGSSCTGWAGHVVGQGFCTLGNILASEEVVQAMAHAYESMDAYLPERLLAALEAGQNAGGDRRGQQSAALLVVREGGSYGGYTDRYIDVRVDEHPAPIQELKRIFRIYDLTLLEREDPSDVVKLEGGVAKEVKEILARAGFYEGSVNRKWDEKGVEALRDYFNINNFENKWRDDGLLWRSIYHYMRDTVS